MPDPSRNAPPSQHRASSASARIVERLAAHSTIGEIVGPDARVESNHGGGGWSWIIVTRDWHIGSEHGRKEIAAARGMTLHLIGQDQIEIMPSDAFDGVELNTQLQAALGVGAFASRRP